MSSRAASHRLTDLQMDLLRVLWSIEPATVTEIQRELAPSRILARTTIATLLSRLEAQGHVGHKARGRTFRYFAITRQESTKQQLLSTLVTKLFDGDRIDLVNHLFGDERPAPEEISALRQLVEAAEETHDD